ncbi:MAG: hypothetical protein JW940_08950 [Polyangiaceae bacterium]|nr:hypothetical protein [Polyangiaceae bacterium]
MLSCALMVTGRPGWYRARQYALGTCAAWVLTVLGVIQPANAQSPAVAAYAAPSTCPDQAWFEAELMRRVAASGEATSPATLSISVRAADAGFVGALRYSDAGSGQATRTVRHQSCEQVVRALALIGAVLAEASAKKQAAPTTLAFDDSAGSRAERGPTRTSALRRVGQADAPREARPEPKEAAWQTRGRLAAGLGVAFALAPDLVMTPRVGLGLERQQERAPLGYRLSVSLSRATSGTLEKYGASAELAWTTGRLDGCGCLRLGPGVSLDGCAYADVGELVGASIEGVTNGHTRRTLWLSPGLGVVIGSTLLGPLGLELGLRGFAPLVRPRFYFNAPDQPDGSDPRWLHRRVPSVGASAEADLVTRFP